MGSWLQRIYHLLVDIKNEMTQIAQKYVSILLRLNTIDNSLTSCCRQLNKRLDSIEERQKSMDKKIDDLIQLLTPPPAVGLVVTIKPINH